MKICSAARTWIHMYIHHENDSPIHVFSFSICTVPWRRTDMLLDIQSSAAFFSAVTYSLPLIPHARCSRSLEKPPECKCAPYVVGMSPKHHLFSFANTPSFRLSFSLLNDWGPHFTYVYNVLHSSDNSHAHVAYLCHYWL